MEADMTTELPDKRTDSTLTGIQTQNDHVRDLWADALQTLPDRDRAKIPQSSSDSKLDVLHHLCAVVEQKRDDCERRDWKFDFKGRQIVLRDLAEKIIVCINKFKEIGDVAINFDPVHMSLPWGGIRFLLQVPTNALVALVTVMKLMLKEDGCSRKPTDGNPAHRR
jgi:hypothetical protein